VQIFKREFFVRHVIPVSARVRSMYFAAWRDE
jgi:hypothetical protein